MGVRQRKLLFDAQRGICASCGIPMLRPSQVVKRWRLHPLGPTTDHVVPTRAGGPDNLTNKVAMHRACNTFKGGRMPNGCELVWLEVVRAKVPQPHHRPRP